MEQCLDELVDDFVIRSEVSIMRWHLVSLQAIMNSDGVIKEREREGGIFELTERG